MLTLAVMNATQAASRGGGRSPWIEIEKGYMQKLSKHKEPLLTTAAVSKWLRISGKTLNSWAESKQIPAVKTGNEWGFRESDLITWVKRQTQAVKKARS